MQMKIISCIITEIVHLREKSAFILVLRNSEALFQKPVILSLENSRLLEALGLHFEIYVAY